MNIQLSIAVVGLPSSGKWLKNNFPQEIIHSITLCEQWTHDHLAVFQRQSSEVLLVVRWSLDSSVDVSWLSCLRYVRLSLSWRASVLRIVGTHGWLRSFISPSRWKEERSVIKHGSDDGLAKSWTLFGRTPHVSYAIFLQLPVPFKTADSKSYEKNRTSGVNKAYFIVPAL